MICFTLAATLAVTFVTAAGTALLAGHCGRIAANDPFSAVRTVLEKRAAREPDETTAGDYSQNADSREMPVIADAENETDDAYLSMLTARIALVLLCAVTAVVTVIFILRRKK